MNPGRGNLFRCAVRETEGQKSNVFRNFGRREGFLHRAKSRSRPRLPIFIFRGFHFPRALDPPPRRT